MLKTLSALDCPYIICLFLSLYGPLELKYGEIGTAVSSESSSDPIARDWMPTDFSHHSPLISHLQVNSKKFIIWTNQPVPGAWIDRFVYNERKSYHCYLFYWALTLPIFSKIRHNLVWWRWRVFTPLGHRILGICVTACRLLSPLVFWGLAVCVCVCVVFSPHKPHACTSVREAAAAASLRARRITSPNFDEL